MPGKFLHKSAFRSQVLQWSKRLNISGGPLGALKRPALLVLDMQNEFLTDEGQLPVWGGPAIIGNVMRLIQAFRQKGDLVVFSRHICLEPHKHRRLIGMMKTADGNGTILREFTRGVEFCRRIKPKAADPVITKYRYSAFFDTALETLLRVNQIQEVVISGVATNICCETTAHDAFFRGFQVFFPLDATGATDGAAHLATLCNIQLSYGKVVTSDQLQQSLVKQASSRNR